MKNQVDPRRFSGKALTRYPSFPHRSDDYSFKIDGLTVGRIMKMSSGIRVFWLWMLTGPHYPTNQRNGEADTFDAALETLKNQFWNWHAWALKQPGNVTWYGAGE